MLKKQEEAIPTSVFDTEAHDQELRASYGPDSVNDGYRPAFLYVERGPGAGQLVQVRQGVMVIGRASVADLRVQHPSISRRHAQVKRVGEQFFIRDLGSQNGTFVNKSRIGAELEITPGDTIALGNATLKLRGPMAKGETPSRPSNPQPQRNRTKAPTKAMSTAVMQRHTSRSSSMVKVAIFTGATMFGLGVVLCLALLRPGSSDTKHPSAKTTTAAAVNPNAPKDVGSAIGDITISLEDAKITEAIKKHGGDAPTSAAAVADVKGTKTGAAIPAAGGKKAASDDDAEDDDASAKKGAGGKKSAILAQYEKGNAEGSLDAAKKAGDKNLEKSLADFIAAYDAAETAMTSGDGSAAIRNFEKALKLDETLGNGWGKYGGTIRKQLSNLYTLVGQAYLKQDNQKNAKLAFATAYKYDQTNDKAKQQLVALGGDVTAAAPAPKSSKNAADDAFGDDDDEKPAKKAAPAPAKKGKSRTQAIDDAFGD
ncbi:MAG: FHA domain-containing protein [Myxococcaceae bacterium]